MPQSAGDKEKYQPPTMSAEQMQAIEAAIAYSRNATDFAKKVIIWTLRQSRNLTRQVALSIPEPFEGFKAEEVQSGVHDMVSCNGTTHIDCLFQAAGTKVHLSHHAGMFVGKHPNFFHNTRARGSTIWVAVGYFSKDAEILTPPTLKEIESIDLKKITHS